MAKYELTFTREWLPVTGQLWDLAEGELHLSLLGISDLTKGYQFFDCYDGLIRNYIDMEGAIDRIYRHILRRAQVEPDFFSQIEKYFATHYHAAAPYLGGKTPQNPPEFQKAFDEIAHAWAAFTVGYWLSYFENPDIPEVLSRRAQKMRTEAETLGEDSNRFFLRVSKYLYGALSEEELSSVTKENLLSRERPLVQKDRHFFIFGGKISRAKSLSEFLEETGIEIADYVSEGTNEIKGQIAFKGTARGPVALCLKEREITKVKEGDIIVASMTAPSFLPAMKRAAAFVTDEGGITCHAAIVAREMQKPCIIGTKFATQIFKDGDVVEVDGETGVVQIITKTHEQTAR
jgi:phosphohistidine swiveling domain-containing protein